MNNYYENYPMPGQDSENNNRNERNDRKEKKDRIRWGRLAACAVAFGLIAGVVFQGVGIASRYLLPEEQTAVTSQQESEREEKEEVRLTKPVSIDQSEPAEDIISAASGNTAPNIASVASSCMPSIVSITNQGVQVVEDFFFGTRQYDVTGAGSGIIVAQSDEELLIATNNHVVENANTLTVSFVNEDSVPAVLKGADAEKDLAVIAVDLDDISSETLDAIKVATLGDSESLQVGETAIAIGNALGYGQSVTTGIVSALNRQIDMEGFSCELIQTDAAINPGNSGGALLNAAGEVIGINTVKVASTGVESMGYAIPISDAEPIINELMNQKTRTIVDEEDRGSLGIRCVDVDSTTAQAYNMPAGLYVSEVMEGSAAEKAGMIQGDVITKFEGASISTAQALQNKLQYYEAGETVTITVQRLERSGEYEAEDLEVTLGTLRK